MATGNNWRVQPVTEVYNSEVAITLDNVRYVLENSEAWHIGAALQDAANYGWIEED